MNINKIILRINSKQNVCLISVSFLFEKVVFSFLYLYNNAIQIYYKVSTILCYSYLKETIGGVNRV